MPPLLLLLFSFSKIALIFTKTESRKLELIGVLNKNRRSFLVTCFPKQVFIFFFVA